MEGAEQVDEFCRSQTSVTAALSKFIECFMEDYEDEEREEQVILGQCVHQLFRKYYFSALDPEMMLTPAKIVTTLCEREFGNRVMPVPVLDCTFKGKKLTRLQYHFVSFGTDYHPMVDDFMYFMESAGSGIRMEAPGIPWMMEYGKLKKRPLLIFDRHYINLLGLIALEAGYIECRLVENQLTGYTTTKAEEYLNLTKTAKLQRLLELTVLLCSRMLTHAFPELHKEFGVLRIAGFLRNPKSFDAVVETIYKKMGLDLKWLDRSLLTGNFEMTLQVLGANEDNLVKLYELQKMLDVYFFTPFGYYLQVIQPVYPDIYDLTKELDELLVDSDNFQTIRNKLFSVAIDFDLTVLGEHFLGKGPKPHRKRRIEERMNDTELCRAVLSSTGYVETAQQAFERDFEGEEYFQPFVKNQTVSPKRKTGFKTKIIDFPLKKIAEVQTDFDQIYSFKVKNFDAKRIWRQIEIRGTQSLHDLHWAIFAAFDFEEEHLYAFFLSNRFDDSGTEYAHPDAGFRSAETAIIGQLGLALKQKIAYVFDFGAERRFEIELLAVQAADAQLQYPRESKRSKLALSQNNEY